MIASVLEVSYSVMDMASKGQVKDNKQLRKSDMSTELENFVLEKGIFSNIFEKDIRRVYIYKKAERLAKAIHLIAPAFKSAPALRDRMGKIAIGLVDAAILAPLAARDALSRELLALSSVLSIARIGGLLSTMNAELITREAHQLLQEVATYEEPRLFLEEAPSLASLAKERAAQSGSGAKSMPRGEASFAQREQKSIAPKGHAKGQVSDRTSGRREAILSVLRSKGPSYIKDISTVVTQVSEKTIQRELQALVDEGEIERTGERRWTQYSLANS